MFREAQSTWNRQLNFSISSAPMRVSPGGLGAEVTQANSYLDVKEHAILVTDQVEGGSNGREIRGRIRTPVQKYVEQDELGALKSGS